MDYKLATLQLINSTWTYSTRKSSKPSKIFGKETNAGFTYSSFLPGQPASPSSDNLIHTIWLNDITDQDAQLYREEYGQQAYIVIDPSKPEDKRCIDLITADAYETLKSTASSQSASLST